jgi:hypothetical protein
VGVLKTEDTDGTIGNLTGILTNNDPWAGLPIMGTSGVDGLMPGTPIVPNTLGLTTELDIFDQTPGSSFTTNSGTVAALGGMAGVTADNHVLLGQFTTDGTFSFKLNVQVGTPVAGESQIFVAENPTGTEILDSTLTYVSSPDTANTSFVHEVNKPSQSMFGVYPNPCADQLMIQRWVADGQRADFSVYTMTGELMYKDAFYSTNHKLNTSNWPAGVYMIHVSHRGQSTDLKFVKF